MSSNSVVIVGGARAPVSGLMLTMLAITDLRLDQDKVNVHGGACGEATAVGIELI